MNGLLLDHNYSEDAEVVSGDLAICEDNFRCFVHRYRESCIDGGPFAEVHEQMRRKLGNRKKNRSLIQIHPC